MEYLHQEPPKKMKKYMAVIWVTKYQKEKRKKYTAKSIITNQRDIMTCYWRETCLNFSLIFKHTFVWHKKSSMAGHY